MPSPFTDRSAGACLACCFLAAATLIFALLDEESGLDALLLPSDVDPEPVQSSPAKQPRATGHRRDAALRAKPRRPAFTDKVVLDAAAASVGMRGGRSRAADDSDRGSEAGDGSAEAQGEAWWVDEV